MKAEVIKQLLDINDRFYQSFGAAFAETRRRLQPGVQRIVDQWIKPGNWLDIGCGSGVLGQRLAHGGLEGSYLGLDFSLPLLEEAQKGAAELDPHPAFDLVYRQANLLDEHWTNAADNRLFDGVMAFAVLHHIPGAEARQRLIGQIYDLVAPGGFFIHSEWQFQHNPKLMARIQPWSLVGLTEDAVELGDTLLDWRHFAEGQADQPGLRYVHLFSKPELAGLASLASLAGFKIVEEFESDGLPGNLGLYQVWQKKA